MVALTRAIGRKRAMEMLLTGEPIDAATACAWGLVNRVVPPDRLHAETLALAGRIAVGEPRRSSASERRRSTRRSISTRRRAYAYAKEVMTCNALEPDAREGIARLPRKATSRVAALTKAVLFG